MIKDQSRSNTDLSYYLYCPFKLICFCQLCTKQCQFDEHNVYKRLVCHSMHFGVSIEFIVGVVYMLDQYIVDFHLSLKFVAK